MVSVRRRAMACEFEVQLAAGRNDDSMEHVFAALDLVESLESQMTVYRDDSEVMRINRRAAHEAGGSRAAAVRTLPAGRTAASAKRTARSISRAARFREAWGFSRREGRVPSDDQIEAARAARWHAARRAGLRAQTIAFRRPGMSINFNSMGKGYALDRMAELLAATRRRRLSAARRQEQRAGPRRPAGFRRHRLADRRAASAATRRAAGRIVLRDQALSTSGAGTQFFIRRGQRYGHILDPRTGQPAEGLYSATVIAPTAAEAEGLSTAFYVMGPNKSGEFCAARPEIAALLVAPGEREGDVRLIALGLDKGQWLRLANT